MITFSKIISAFFEKGTRVLKVNQYGVKTADECSSFGDDSNPIKNMIAIFAETEVNGNAVIIGYINENQLAQIGEKRLYSLKETGELSTYIWLKNDGNILLGGDSDNVVRYSPLAQAVSGMDLSINAELVKIQQAIATLGGTYARTNISTDLTNAKVNELKTP